MIYSYAYCPTCGAINLPKVDHCPVLKGKENCNAWVTWVYLPCVKKRRKQ